MTQLINESVSDKAVIRTDPATPGLLNSHGQESKPEELNFNFIHFSN